MKHKQSRKKVRRNKKSFSSKIYKTGATVLATLIIILMLFGGSVAACYFAGLFNTNDSEDYVGKKTNTTSNSKLDESYQTGPKRFMSYVQGERYRPLSLKAAMNFCKANGGKKLPLPSNKLQEQQLIKDVKRYHKEAQCGCYIIGYTLNPDVRYKTLNDRRRWPSLRISVAASIVTNDRDCVRLQLAAPGQSFAVIDYKPCKEVHDYHCVIGYINNRTNCLGRFGDHCFHTVDAAGYNPEDMFNDYKNKLEYYGTRENGLLLIDRDVVVLEYAKILHSQPKICWALDVKYHFEYLDVYESGPCPYSIEAVVLNPEYECLVIESTTFQLQTRRCKDGGCPLCEVV